MTIAAPNTNRLDDEDTERMRQEHERVLAAMLGLPSAGLVVLRDVVLKNNATTPIAHGQGRYVTHIVTPPRNASSAGAIWEIRDGSVDRKMFLNLHAAGWGADVTVDVWVL